MGRGKGGGEVEIYKGNTLKVCKHWEKDKRYKKNDDHNSTEDAPETHKEKEGKGRRGLDSSPLLQLCTRILEAFWHSLSPDTLIHRTPLLRLQIPHSGSKPRLTPLILTLPELQQVFTFGSRQEGRMPELVVLEEVGERDGLLVLVGIGRDEAYVEDFWNAADGAVVEGEGRDEIALRLAGFKEDDEGPFVGYDGIVFEEAVLVVVDCLLPAGDEVWLGDDGVVGGWVDLEPLVLWQESCWGSAEDRGEVMADVVGAWLSMARGLWVGKNCDQVREELNQTGWREEDVSERDRLSEGFLVGGEIWDSTGSSRGFPSRKCSLNEEDLFDGIDSHRGRRWNREIPCDCIPWGWNPRTDVPQEEGGCDDPC